MADPIREFTQHYTKCWGIMDFGKLGTRPVCMRGHHSGSKFVIHRLDKEKAYDEITMDYKDLQRVKWYEPETRFFNGNETAGYYTLQPIRQYAKGMTIHPSSVQMLHGNLEYAADMDAMKDCCWNWNNDFVSFAETLAKLKNGERLGGAFSNSFAMTCFKGFDFPIIYHKTTPIGRFLSWEEIGISPKFKMFKEALVRYSGTGIKVGEL